MASEEMMRETIESGGANLARIKKQANTRKRNQGLKPVSDDQKARNERLKRDKAFALDVMKKTQGFFSCQICGGAVESPDDLQWAHLDRRTRGGSDHWSRMVLAESGPHTRQCHERYDGNLLQWSNGNES